MTFVSSTWSFVKRHKGKFVILGAGIGGFIYLNRFLSSVERNWDKSASKDFVSEVRKKDTHYENSIRTCNQTCATLSLKILDNLDALLNSDEILQQLRLQTTNVSLWNDLKVVIFTRAAAEVYSICLFVCYLRVQLLVIAGYIYVGSSNSDSVNTSLNHKIQLQYLSLLHTFYEKGISEIVTPVKEAVIKSLTNIKLKDQLTAKDLQNVFDEIKGRVSLKLKGNTSRFLMKPDHVQSMLDESSNDSSPVSNSELRVLHKLVDETQDILETDDFGKALNATVEVGFSHLMDLMLQCFLKSPDETSSKTNGSISDDYDSNGTGQFTNPNLVSIPLVKLLPEMKKVLEGRTTTEERQSLVREIFSQDLLNCYSANVYETFCEAKN